MLRSDQTLLARLMKKYGRETVRASIETVVHRGPGRPRRPKTKKEADILWLVEYVDQLREEFEAEGESAPLKRAFEETEIVSGLWVGTVKDYYRRGRSLIKARLSQK